jgi:cytochrome c-type biogenesis protein
LPFISLITGISVDNLKTSKKLSKNVIIKTLFFVLVFSFIFLGMSASQLGSFFSEYKTLLRYISSCIVILFGLHVSALLKIKFLYKQFSYTDKNSTTVLTNIGIFFTGATFALGWTPCICPVLASILIVASTQGTVLNGFWLLMFFL